MEKIEKPDESLFRKGVGQRLDYFLLKIEGNSRTPTVKKTGIAKGSLSLYINGVRTMSIYQLALIKMAYPEIDLNDIIAGTPTRKPISYDLDILKEKAISYKTKTEELQEALLAQVKRNNRLELELEDCRSLKP